MWPANREARASAAVLSPACRLRGAGWLHRQEVRTPPVSASPDSCHCGKASHVANRQGNRISDLGEELCEVGVVPAGPFDFDTQGAFGGFLGKEIKGHMAQDGEVMRAVIAAISGIVLII